MNSKAIELTEIDLLLFKKKKLLQEKQNCIFQLNTIEKDIENIEKEIIDNCNHNWINDPNYSPAPYEKPDLYCTKCHSISYRW